MRELVRIVVPGGLVLDPFAGAGNTGLAALAEGRRFIGIEMHHAYAAIARRRLAAAVRFQTSWERPTRLRTLWGASPHGKSGIRGERRMGRAQRVERGHGAFRASVRTHPDAS
jgi:hypothetical protein